MYGSRAVLVGCVVALTASRNAHGEDDACAHPPTELIRYEEDYSFLRDPACRTDFWDPLKYIAVSEAPDTYVSLGADVRERVEYVHNQDWGRLPSDGYLLSRFMVHGDVHAGAHLRAFVQLASAFVTGRAGGPRQLDEDLLDVHQAFLEVSVAIPSLGQLTLRAGRQEVDYPSARLIAVRDGANVRLSFDGLRAIQRVGTWHVDALALAPVETASGVFDDGWEPGQRLWGLYSSGPVVPDALALDVYYLGLLRDKAVFDQGAARELRHSVGARLSGGVANVDYNTELVFQFGTFGAGRIRAWTVASDTGYTFTTVHWRPRIGGQANVTSGDKDRNHVDLQTFDPLFPRAAYFSEANLIGPLNHIDLHPALGLQPTDSFSFALAWDVFWRYSLADALYRMSGVPQVTVTDNPERFVGSEGSVSAVWNVAHGTAVFASYTHFFAGPFLRRAGLGHDVDFVAGWLSYRI
jgi:hypothetical protein